MSIYFIRHAGLVKIGYSSRLAERIGAIKASIPSPDVTLVGYMPGDRDVEAHLHQVFAKHRFSGEWFFFAPELVTFAQIALIPELPVSAGRAAYRTSGSRQSRQALEDLSQAMRQACAVIWPAASHAERRLSAAEFLGWSPRRARSVYEASKGCALRQYEAEDLDKLIAHSKSLAPAGAALEITRPDDQEEHQ